MGKMKKESLYLDTSVISAYYDERALERKEATQKFWEKVLPDYKCYISEITLDELNATKNEDLRKKFNNLVKSFTMLKTNEKIRDLAKYYIAKEIFPEKYFDDALHVAVASFYEIPYLLSWNFEHLVKVKTRRMVKLVNTLDGLREIEIISPEEL
jgi:predicted nucleic acid-binding protein